MGSEPFFSENNCLLLLEIQLIVVRDDSETEPFHTVRPKQ